MSVRINVLMFKIMCIIGVSSCMYVQLWRMPIVKPSVKIVLSNIKQSYQTDYFLGIYWKGSYEIWQVLRLLLIHQTGEGQYFW